MSEFSCLMRETPRRKNFVGSSSSARILRGVQIQPWGVSSEPRVVKVPPPALPSNLSEILNYGFWMRRQGYRPSTIQAAISTLKAVAKKTNQDAVKTHLASRNVSVGRKEKICVDLARFYRFKGILFQMPRYQRINTIPFVPQEKEVDQLHLSLREENRHLPTTRGFKSRSRGRLRNPRGRRKIPRRQNPPGPHADSAEVSDEVKYVSCMYFKYD